MAPFQVLTIQESLNVGQLDGQRKITTQQAPDTMAAPMRGASHEGQGQMPATYQMSAPLNEAELTALLMASPMYQKLENMKKSLAGQAAGGGKKGKGAAAGKI